MANLIIGLGNCGSVIVKEIAKKESLKDTILYAIDSQTGNISLDTVDRVNFIPIIADEKAGSGRNRERGKALYEFHEKEGTLDALYKIAEDSTSPILVITSSAGGTGSGSCPSLVHSLMDLGLKVIPIIVTPHYDDPDAYHLNSTDLMIELDEVAVKHEEALTYSIFRNEKSSNYAKVNKDVVDFIEVITGGKYGDTNSEKDTIDPSDLETILSTPGRIIATYNRAENMETLKRDMMRNLLSGSQPTWDENSVSSVTLMIAVSLKSMYADVDISDLIDETCGRFPHTYDIYRHVDKVDNGGMLDASIIICGLPRTDIKEIDVDFNESSTIGSNMKRSNRPSFLKKKKASTTTTEDGKKKFNWI